MEDVTKEFIRLFKSGLSIKEVADITERKYKTAESVTRRYRDEIGVINKYKVNFANETYFDIIDSEDKAYLLGFFLADGCIDGSKHRNGEFCNRFAITNSIDDLSAILLFQEKICPKSIMYKKNNQDGVVFRKEQLSLRWSSIHMTNVLIDKYNFCRLKAYNKDFSFPFETIPKDLVRHFIRGFFDGDGSVDFAILKTKNGIDTTRFQYGFICNSYPFAKQLSDIVCDIIGGVEGTIGEIDGKTTNWFTLRFNTFRINSLEKRYAFYKYLYEDSTYFLERKKIKFDKFFEYRGKQVV